jgi:LytS/YehU family sensor histidine kinase
VQATRTGSTAYVTVTNTCDPDRPKRRGTGVGLVNVRRRLTSQFPDESAVEVRELADEHRVELRFPIQTADVQRADTGT